MRKTFALITIMTLIAMVSFASADSHKKNPYEGNADAINKGQQIFLDNCSECHGDNATGGSGPGLTDDEWWYGGSDAEVFKTISNGEGFSMPAWLGNPLTEDDIWNVISFIRSLHKD
jgi:cbb3-type cytochrome c oxidase subunit III